MKLWGGRFTKETNQLVHNFNESLSFDQKFYRQDIRGSIAHEMCIRDRASDHRSPGQSDFAGNRQGASDQYL